VSDWGVREKKMANGAEQVWVKQGRQTQCWVKKKKQKCARKGRANPPQPENSQAKCPRACQRERGKPVTMEERGASASNVSMERKGEVQGGTVKKKREVSLH